MGDDYPGARRFLARRVQLSRCRKEIRRLVRRHIAQAGIEFPTTPSQLLDGVLERTMNGAAEVVPFSRIKD
jgi:hypothetical protein